MKQESGRKVAQREQNDISITPYPKNTSSSGAEHATLTSFSCSKSYKNNKPWLVTSSLPRISQPSKSGHTQVVQHLNEEADDWIRYRAHWTSDGRKIELFWQAS